MTNIRNRAAKVFDTTFQELITPDLIKLIYILAVAVYAVFIVVGIVAGFGKSTNTGVFLLVLSPLYFALGVLPIRVCLELLIVVFRMERHLRELSRIAQQQPHSEP